jgi:hypothetical protein
MITQNSLKQCSSTIYCQIIRKIAKITKTLIRWIWSQLLWDDNAADLFIPNFFDKTPKSFKIKYDQVDGGADEENPQNLQENAMDFEISSK